MAFARGVHSCPGAPLARVEGRVSIERILDRMSDITINEAQHGPADERRYTFEPTYILRGLSESAPDVHAAARAGVGAVAARATAWLNELRSAAELAGYLAS